MVAVLVVVELEADADGEGERYLEGTCFNLGFLGGVAAVEDLGGGGVGLRVRDIFRRFCERATFGGSETVAATIIGRGVWGYNLTDRLRHIASKFAGIDL